MLNPFRQPELIKAATFMSMPAKFRKKMRTAWSDANRQGAEVDSFLEDIRALQNDLFQEMVSVIEGYEGFVEKFVGDAVMAVFGAPIAHEDDPERALRAALAMQERVAKLNERWERRLGQPLALHIGVNTGWVVAGSIGGGSYAVTGDTVNTASRLQSAAPKGEILVSHTTLGTEDEVGGALSGRCRGRRADGARRAVRTCPSRSGQRSRRMRRHAESAPGLLRIEFPDRHALDLKAEHPAEEPGHASGFLRLRILLG